MADVTCGTCRFYKGPKKLPEGVRVPPGFDTTGQCQRYPTPLRKFSDDYWCGEWREADRKVSPK